MITGQADTSYLSKWFLARISCIVNQNLYSQFKGLATWDSGGDSKKGRKGESRWERERDEMETDGNPILLQRIDSAELSFSNCLSCLAFSAQVWHEEALIIHLHLWQPHYGSFTSRLFCPAWSWYDPAIKSLSLSTPPHVQHTGDRHSSSLTMFLFPAEDDSFDITGTFHEYSILWYPMVFSYAFILRELYVTVT